MQENTKKIPSTDPKHLKNPLVNRLRAIHAILIGGQLDQPKDTICWVFILICMEQVVHLKINLVFKLYPSINSTVFVLKEVNSHY